MELGKKFNSAVFPGLQGGPLMHVIASKAVCFKEALQDDFKIYAKTNELNFSSINAILKIPQRLVGKYSGELNFDKSSCL